MHYESKDVDRMQHFSHVFFHGVEKSQTHWKTSTFSLGIEDIRLEA